MKIPVRRCLLAFLLCGLLCPAQRSFGAVEMFLKLAGIDGESTDKAHPNEIVTLAFSQGVTSTITPAGGSATFSDFSITKTVDKATPLLYLTAAQGKHISQAVLTVRNSGATPFDFYQIILTDVMISSVQSSGSAGADRPTETLTLKYAQIEWTYTPQNPDGTAGMPVVATWNLTKNTP